MKSPNRNKPAGRSFRSLACAGLLGLAGSAGAIEVTGSFTGWWGQPDQQNHGVIVSVSRRGDGSLQGVFFWAHYDDQGNPSWLFGQGPIEGDTVNASLRRFDGITFMQPDDPDFGAGETIGSMQVQFDDCANGDVNFETIDSVVGTGGFRIQRLTNQPGTNCSGGQSDNIPPTAPPEEFRTFLVATGVIPGASGKADFEARPGRSDFSVEVEDVPTGAYELRVAGVARGTIDVESTPGGNEGEIEFRSPPEPGKLLLDFDPRDAIIEIARADGQIVLEGATPTDGEVPGQGNGNPPPFGNVEIEVDLINAGVFPAGSGDAEFEQRSNRVDFDVEIEDVPTGGYTLRVGGIERGTIEVVETVNGPEGELEFRFPAEAGKLPLDFDPRGQAIEVLDGATLVFSVDFPSTGNDDGDDDSGGGDDGDDDSGGGDDGDDDSGGGDDGDDDSGGGDDDDTTGDVEIELPLTSSGVIPGASGEADFEQRSDRTDFSVEIEDVPAGGYPLRVGGIVRGTIEVVEVDGGTEGELEFRDPVEPGKLPLEFDPRGQAVEVLDGNNVILTGDFPG